MSKINKIKVNGTPYEVEDKEAVKTVTLTQAEYDALQTKDPSIFYVISDGQGGGGGMTSGEVQTMIDSSISGKADSSGVTQEISAATSGKVDTTTFNTYSGAVDTALSGKQETLVSGTNIKTINNESILGSGNITISGGGSGSSAVEVTQAEYDALVSGGTLDPSVLYIITDAVGGDLSNYMTSAQTMNAISAATSTKQDILSAGTGIDITDNTISVTGGSGGGKAVSGGTNISITTGETADTINCTLPITATSSKVSLTLFGNSQEIPNPYSVNFGYNNNFGTNPTWIYNYGIYNSTPMYGNKYYVNFGEHNSLEGYGFEYTFGEYLKSVNQYEFAFGKYNKSNNGSTNADKTLFSVGNGNGTADNARHNAFEIRQNGDIYITKDGQDVKLQDQLGGGGGGGTTEDDELLLSTALTDLNDRKIDASEVKANYQRKGDYVTTNTLNTRLAEYETALDEQNVEEVTAYALNDLNNKFGGLSLVKITESEYAALTTKDENTLYVVIADPE